MSKSEHGNCFLTCFTLLVDNVHEKRQKLTSDEADKGVVSPEKNGKGPSLVLTKSSPNSSLPVDGTKSPVSAPTVGGGVMKDGSESSLTSAELLDAEAMNTFPGRLMDFLDQGVASDAMWWLESGDGFCVVPKLFTEKVLDQYFQGTKFESFTRKLNRW